MNVLLLQLRLYAFGNRILLLHYFNKAKSTPIDKNLIIYLTIILYTKEGKELTVETSTGLGLSIVKQSFSSSYNGDIAVSSDEGVETTFVVTLPIGE